MATIFFYTFFHQDGTIVTVRTDGEFKSFDRKKIGKTVNCFGNIGAHCVECCVCLLYLCRTITTDLYQYGKSSI
jgi:hypothetical protein